MFRELFNRERSVTVQTITQASGGNLESVEGPAEPTTTTTVEREGVFVTPQSLVSFAGATGAVTLVWKALGALHADWDKMPIVALGISALVGVAIYLINDTDPAAPPATTRQRLISIMIAVINTFVIFSAAVGVTQVATT